MREVRARALGYAGYFREAIDQGTRAIHSMFATFGPTNQVAATALLTLAGWERRIGRIDSSLKHATDGLDILEPQISRHSWDFANGLTTLGATQIAARRPAEALANLTEAEQILSELFGATQWETLTARFHRGVALAYLGRHEEARELFAIAGDPKVRIDAPLWFAHVDGIVKRLDGDLDGAVAAQQAALALIVEGPLADWDRVRILSELGLAELARGHESAARAALSKARELSQKLEIEMNPSYAEVVAALARSES
jgi:tetratricopeptide (TPR) repeat protein